MRLFQAKTILPTLVLASSLAPMLAQASTTVTLNFTNLSGANGVALSPFFVAFHSGSYDAFDTNETASSAIKAIAEAGNGGLLSTDFTATNSNGLSQTVTASTNAFGPGIFLPGATGSITVELDPVKNRYLSYFAMVVPSNDRFIGNESPTEIALFDDQGNFTGGSFVDNGNKIWDAGTELDGTTGAAFLAGSNGAENPLQNGIIQANNDFSVYSGLATAAGYNFTNLPGANTPLLRIDAAISAVPVPAAVWLFGSAIPLLGFTRRKNPAINA